MGFLSLFLRKKTGIPVSEDRFREAILFAEQREIRSQFEGVMGKKVLEISPRLPSLGKFLQEKGVGFHLTLKGPEEKDGAVIVRWETLPFLDDSWDFILLRTPFFRGNLARLLREISRILKKGGTALISEFHPFSEMVQQEHLKNPVGEDGMGPGFERYFKMFREGGFSLQWVRELFFEGSMRKFFVSTSERDIFDQWRRTPFMIFFVVMKE